MKFLIATSPSSQGLRPCRRGLKSNRMRIAWSRLAISLWTMWMALRDRQERLAHKARRATREMMEQMVRREFKGFRESKEFKASLDQQVRMARTVLSGAMDLV